MYIKVDRRITHANKHVLVCRLDMRVTGAVAQGRQGWRSAKAATVIPKIFALLIFARLIFAVIYYSRFQEAAKKKPRK